MQGKIQFSIFRKKRPWPPVLCRLHYTTTIIPATTTVSYGHSTSRMLSQASLRKGQIDRACTKALITLWLRSIRIRWRCIRERIKWSKIRRTILSQQVPWKSKLNRRNAWDSPTQTNNKQNTFKKIIKKEIIRTISRMTYHSSTSKLSRWRKTRNRLISSRFAFRKWECSKPRNTLTTATALL